MHESITTLESGSAVDNNQSDERIPAVAINLNMLAELEE